MKITDMGEVFNNVTVMYPRINRTYRFDSTENKIATLPLVARNDSIVSLDPSNPVSQYSFLHPFSYYICLAEGDARIIRRHLVVDMHRHAQRLQSVGSPLEQVHVLKHASAKNHIRDLMERGELFDDPLCGGNDRIVEFR